MVSLEEADRWKGLWSARIAPSIFSLLGGEPTLHDSELYRKKFEPVVS